MSVLDFGHDDDGANGDVIKYWGIAQRGSEG